MAKVNYADAEERFNSSNLALTCSRLKLEKRPSIKLDLRHPHINPSLIRTHIEAWGPEWLHLQGKGLSSGKDEPTSSIVGEDLITVDDVEVISSKDRRGHQTDLRLRESRAIVNGHDWEQYHEVASGDEEDIWEFDWSEVGTYNHWEDGLEFVETG